MFKNTLHSLRSLKKIQQKFIEMWPKPHHNHLSQMVQCCLQLHHCNSHKFINVQFQMKKSWHEFNNIFNQTQPRCHTSVTCDLFSHECTSYLMTQFHFEKMTKFIKSRMHVWKGPPFIEIIKKIKFQQKLIKIWPKPCHNCQSQMVQCCLQLYCENTNVWWWCGNNHSRHFDHTHSGFWKCREQKFGHHLTIGWI